MSCPKGFVIPEDLDSPDNWFVDREVSDCAVACKMPMFTPSQWHQLETIEAVSIYVGLPLVLVMLAVYLLDRDKRGQYLVISFGTISLGVTTVNAVLQSIPWEERFCRNNANLLDASDGFSYCALQSFVTVYGSLALCMCWLIQSVGVYLKIALGWRNLPRRALLHILLIFVLPLLSVAVLARSGQYGYSWAATQCTFSPAGRASGLDVAVLYGPITVMCACGVFCMCSVIAKIVHIIPTSARAEEYAAAARLIALKRVPSEDQEEDQDDQEDAALELGSSRSSLRATALKRHLQAQAQLAGRPPASLSVASSLEVAADSTGGTDSDASEGSSSSSSGGGGRGGAACADASAAKILQESSFRSQMEAAGLRSLWEIVVFLRTPLLFLSFFCFVYVSIIAVGLVARSWYGPVADSFQHWAECAVHTHVPGDDDGAWRTICGSAPARAIPMGLRGYLTVVFSGQSMFVALIYSPGVVSWLHKRLLSRWCCDVSLLAHLCWHGVKVAYEPSYESSEVAQSFVSFNIEGPDSDQRCAHREGQMRLHAASSPRSQSANSAWSDASAVLDRLFTRAARSPCRAPNGGGRPILAFSETPSHSQAHSPVGPGGAIFSPHTLHFSPKFSPPPYMAPPSNHSLHELCFSPTRHQLPGFFSPSRAHVRVAPAKQSLGFIEEAGESGKTVGVTSYSAGLTTANQADNECDCDCDGTGEGTLSLSMQSLGAMRLPPIGLVTDEVANFEVPDSLVPSRVPSRVPTPPQAEC